MSTKPEIEVFYWRTSEWLGTLRYHLVFTYNKRVYGVVFRREPDGSVLSRPTTCRHTEIGLSLWEWCTDARNFARHMPKSRKKRPYFCFSSLPLSVYSAVCAFIAQELEENPRASKTPYVWKVDE